MKTKYLSLLFAGCLFLWQSSAMALGGVIVDPQTGMQVQPVQENTIKKQNKVSLTPNHDFTSSTPALNVQQPKPVLKPVAQSPVPAAKPVLSAPSISRPVSGSAIMAPKAVVSPVPTMPVQPVQPESRGFAPARPAPALTVKPISPVTPLSSSAQVLTRPDSAMQQVAPGIMSKPAPVIEVPSVKNSVPQGFVPTGSIGLQRHKSSGCNPLNDTWGCRKPGFLSVQQQSRLVGNGLSITEVLVKGKDAQSLRVWRIDGGKKLLSTYKISAKGQSASITVPASALLGRSFKEGTRMQLELLNPHGKALYAVQLSHNPVTPGQLNLKGKRDVNLGAGLIKADKAVKTTKKTVMEMDPAIIVFAPSPAEKGSGNQYLTSESATYQLKYQVRDADEIRIKLNNTTVFHKKGLDPDKTVSGAVPVDAMKNRYGQAKRKPGLEEFTLEVMRYTGFAVKKISRKIRVLYSKANLADPEIKKFQIEKIKVKRVEQEKGRVFDRRIVTLKLVFKNAVKVKLEQRTDDNPTFTAIALEKMWQNLSSDSGREHVLYKTVNLPLYDPENRNRKVYFKATIEGQFGNKDTELLLVDIEGKRVKQGKQLDWKGVRFVDIKNNTDWYASRAFWVTMQYRYIRQLELYFSDDKNCTITVYKRKFKQARSSLKTEAGLTIPPHKLLSCLENATEPGKAVRQKLYGYLYVKYEDDTGAQVTRMYPKPVTIGYNSTNDDVLFHNVLITNVLEVSPPMPETIQVVKSADNPRATPVLLGQDIRLKYKGYGVDWLEAVLVTEDGQQEKWFSVTGQGKSNEVNINKTKTLHKFYTGLLVRYEGLQRGGAETRLVQKFFSFKTHKPVSLEVNVKLVNEISFYKNSSYQLVYLCKALDSTNLAVANAYGVSFLKTIKKGDSRLEKIKVGLDIAGLSLDVKNAVIKCEIHVSGVLNKLSKTVTSTKIIPLSELEKSRYIRMPSVKLPITGKQ